MSAEQAAAPRTVQLVHRWDASRVLFTFDVPADVASGMEMWAALRAATSSDADLSGADLSGADPSGIKADLFDVLVRAPREIPALRAALVDGKVDGSCYEGSCACLVGTIANARGVGYRSLGAGIEPNFCRPIEAFFMSICRGDTPATNQVSALCVEWVDEFAALMGVAAQAFIEVAQ